MVAEKQTSLFMGIDVQESRGCACFVMNQQRSWVDSCWTDGGTHAETAARLAGKIRELQARHQAALHVGIDAPRVPLPAPRLHYWDGGRKKWRPKRAGDKGYGRHCEIVIKACNIANPQWTRPADSCPSWMHLGFRIYEALSGLADVHEVFPSASYYLLNKSTDAAVRINFADFLRGPKDMLDACMAAVTVFEYVRGRGMAVGGGDGLGTIILPRPLAVETNPAVHKWPG
jgi:hypothetical protein